MENLKIVSNFEFNQKRLKKLKDEKDIILGFFEELKHIDNSFYGTGKISVWVPVFNISTANKILQKT